ncbi:dTDP-4-keto-6-deoxy-D-glucose epimerase [Streptomyces sp. SID14478]|uniref:dTDP-4-dehydrorhamnose 3,5-epimerase family protein n=1 Tax=Streptomyces sp. SID14478 TaxID=2706073 RepID=UPI0013DF742B|nr:dTDP-4-dehydrorhamnose 3,5-epimerase family protein [Streptomyces sp. SID14478]NEB81693.1 dTDP-4-keto-6-deoxy-D-glucose epimerase [Streptomyces sp. SID14478]
MTTRQIGATTTPTTVRELAIEGALEFTPTVYPDERGLFVTTYQQAQFVAATEHPFPFVQTSHSVSRRGVVRGVHYTATPPGMAKHVYCARGRARDFVVDLRVGSPTFGQWDTIELDQEHCRSTYLPVGVGHVFVALEDETTMMYQMSGPYVAQDELAVSPLDPALGLPVTIDGVEPVLSGRDVAAPTLAQALEAGVLPDYETCRALEAVL